MDFFVLSPTVPAPATLKQEDVWGNHQDNYTGMAVAKSGEVCPIFGDVVPHKSVTVVCKKEQLSDVTYWLEYVHGGGSVSRMQDHDDYVSLRSDYKCW